MNRRYVRSESALWRRTSGAVILLPVGENEPITIVGPLARVWDVLIAPSALDEVVEALRSCSSTFESPIQRDLAELLTDLERRGLVTADEAP